MSNIFDEFFPEETPNITVSQFENDAHRHLRERYDSLADRAELDILFFDPTAQRSFHQIMLRTGEDEHEEAEPQVASMMMHNMLRRVSLDAPTDQQDPRYLANQNYKNGVRSSVFQIKRSDRVTVPVYSETETDGVTPRLLCLMSTDLLGETMVHYRQLDKYRNQLKQRMKIGENILLKLSADDLRDYSALYDGIQSL